MAYTDKLKSKISISTALSIGVITIVSFMINAIESSDFVKADHYLSYLIILFSLYLIVYIRDHAGDIASWIEKVFINGGR